MSRGDHSTELKTARSQRRRLTTMYEKLCVMSGEWEGLSGAQETEAERLAEAVSEQIRRLDDDIAWWRGGGGEED